MERLRGFLIKIFAVLALCGVAFLIINPIRQAKDKKVDEYRDFYRYQLTAKNYYRVLHSSIYNLTVLSSKITAGDAFTVLQESSVELDTDRDFTNKLNTLYGTLRTLPDPDDRSMVSSVLECHKAYHAYRDYVLSGQYSKDDYLKTLQDLRLDLRKVERDLYDEVYE